jgi:hypothetical protein
MPLSSEQILALQTLLGKRTLYLPSTDHGWIGTYIVDSIEIAMDSSRQRARELCIPDSFIRGDKAQFWYQIAAVASGMNEFYWHELDIQTDGSKRRYVFTWTIGDAILKFYTKTFHAGGAEHLRWYVCRFADEESNIDSGCDTDSENVMLDEED